MNLEVLSVPKVQIGSPKVMSEFFGHHEIWCRAIVRHSWLKPLNNEDCGNTEGMGVIADIRDFNEFEVNLNFVGCV